MGGAFVDTGKFIQTAGTLGLDQAGGDVGKFFKTGAGSWDPISKSITGLGTYMNQGADAATRATQTQQAATNSANANANNLAEQQLLQPKTITPDNFLADKMKQIQNLRLGLASTISSSGGAPAGALSAPSLSGSSPGKRTLGS